MKKTSALVSIITLSIISSCTTEEIANSKDVNPETIFTTYSINYNEKNNKVDTRAQFRFGGAAGTTLVLDSASSVSLDGIKLNVDSTKSSGAYYDNSFATSSFIGKHNYVFTANNGKSYSNGFSFVPLKLTSKIPKTISGDVVLSFTGIEDGKSVMLEVSDTVSSTPGFDTSLTVQNGKATLKGGSLRELANGLIKLDMHTETKTNLKETTAEGGIMITRNILYTREATLKH